MSAQPVEQAIADVTNVLLYPVLVLALLALALVLVEVGRLVVELGQRRGRSQRRLDGAITAARTALEAGRPGDATAALRPVAASSRMAAALAELVAAADPIAGRVDGVVEGGVEGWAAAEPRRAKLLADFDYGSLRRLERSRVLVRAGPALGLMGTLIPLSPALQSLSQGNISRLADNLRVAFSVTVVGLLTGALAFAVSLVRDRLYGQDLSDLEYVAAQLSPRSSPAAPAGRE